MPSVALVKSRNVGVGDDSCSTCGSVSTPVDESMSPETTRTSPLASTVVVGYQRPAFMFGYDVQRSVAGSYLLACDRPTLFCMCPPAVNSDPSDRKVWPLQKRS